MQSRLSQFMTRHGITRAEVAKLLGLDPSAVSRKIAGQRPWKLDEVQRLIQALGHRQRKPVSYEELFAPELAKARKGAA